MLSRTGVDLALIILYMGRSFSTKYWHKLENGRIQCDLCPRACKLKNGQTGLCFVRACQNDQIVLTTYGKSSGYCIDPIEKKPLHHFLPGTPILSFGTAGCNLTCKFCQNWDISKSKETATLTEYAMPSQIANAAKQLACTSVAFTYNEPIIFMEYAIDVAKECHKHNIKTVAVTAGYICPEPRKEFFQYIDAANVDLKAFTENSYHKLTGAHLEDILDTLKHIKHSTNTWLEITTLLIPGENDSPKDIEKMSCWIMENLGPDVPLHFTAFHPAWKMLDTPPTPIKTLALAREIAIKNGLHYVYTGNVHDSIGGNTYCTYCKEVLIKRNWYSILTYNLDNNGLCINCHTPCAGVFQGNCGTWGSKCQPISLKNC